VLFASVTSRQLISLQVVWQWRWPWATSVTTVTFMTTDPVEDLKPRVYTHDVNSRRTVVMQNPVSFSVHERG
jgi:hypothetical protein